MNEIKVFNSEEFGEIRTVIINGEPYFVGRDIATKLGYVKPENAIPKWCDSEDTLKWGIPSKGGEQQTLVINESGLYALIFGSKLETAKKFKRWVTSEVLPSIRKTGTYGQAQLPQTTEGKIALLAQGHVELKAEVDEIKAEVENIKSDMPILPLEADNIVNAVKKRGVEVMGGKNAPAYNDRALRQRIYNDLYADLKHNFDVRTYKAIRRKDAGKAVVIVEGYKPPLFLAEQIEDANAQQSLEL